MLNKIQPALCIRLRRHSKLTRKQFAVQLGVNRDTLRNYETGKTRPDPETEQRMLEISRCSDLELVEMLCEILSDELGMRVAIIDGEGYRPATTLARAERVRWHYEGELSDVQRQALDHKLHGARLNRLLYEWHNAELDEYTAGCRAEAEQRRRTTTDPLTTDPLTQGATGPAERGSYHGAEPAFDNAGGAPSSHMGTAARPRQYVEESES